MMRHSKPVLRSTAVICLFAWTVYSHVSSRRLIYQELHSLRGHTSRYLQESDSEAPVAKLEQNELLGVVVGSQQHSKFLVGPEVDKSDSFRELLFERGFEENRDSNFPQGDGASGSRQVWLYSLINCDYNGAALVPHFMRHYSDLGIHSHMMYVDLLHDPALPDDGLQEAQRQFRSVGMFTRIVWHAYTPFLQDLAMITGLSKMPMDPEDWVIVADMDEYFTFGDKTNVQEAVQAMEQEGASFAVGEMLDHVAPGGALRQVETSTDIWSQFPLICPVVANIAKGLPAKVTMHKAYLRSGAGHHHIVEPDLAEAYFSGSCEGVQCELVMKRYKQRTTQDVFDLTPYREYASRYADAANSPGWQAKAWLSWTKVHHFKWHAAVLDNLLSRMLRDSGNCILDINEDACQPKFPFWKEVARQFTVLNTTRSIDISGLECKEGVDTLWNW